MGTLSKPGGAISRAVIARGMLAALAVVLIAWFGLLARDHELGTAASQRIVDEPDMGAAQWHDAMRDLKRAELLDPSTDWSLIRAQYLLLRDRPAALAVAEDVLRREPDNLGAWWVVLRATRTSDPARQPRGRAADPPAQPDPLVRELIHHVALALSVLALGQAALRIASTAAPRGLERLIAAIVIGVAIAIAEALGLGLVSPRRQHDRARVGGRRDLGGRRAPAAAPRHPRCWASWPAGGAGLSGAQRAGAAALRRRVRRLARLAAPATSRSGSTARSTTTRSSRAGWTTASRAPDLALSYDIPYGSYPMTDEVALTWGAAISRSWVPLAVWNPLLLGVLALAGWLTLRNLSVPRPVAGLAVAALASAPLMVRQLNEPQTDLPALAWLACVAGLATAAGRRPALLAPAVVAAGLAIGTKPSTGPMAVAALAVGAVMARGRLRPLAGRLAVALAAAFVVGGVWYLRNLIQHGSPLWPFAPGPFGDPAPRFLGLVDATFLQRPVDTLDGRVATTRAASAGPGCCCSAALAALAAAPDAPGAARCAGRFSSPVGWRCWAC